MHTRSVSRKNTIIRLGIDQTVNLSEVSCNLLEILGGVAKTWNSEILSISATRTLFGDQFNRSMSGIEEMK